MKDKVLLLGVGNEIIGDDRVGIEIVRFIESFCIKDLYIDYAGISGFRLLDYIREYTHAIIVDAAERNYDNIDNFKVQIYDKQDIIEHSLLWNSHEESLGLGLSIAMKTFPKEVPKYIKFVAIDIPFQSKYSYAMSDQTCALAKIAIDKIFDLLEELNVCSKPNINMEFLTFHDFRLM